MVAATYILSSIAAASAVSATSGLILPRHVLSVLAARQDLSPGSPAYNCHDNCGQGLLFIKSGVDVCTDEDFLTDYKNCLQCSGPDNVDIWKYYGTGLKTAAAACGLSTTPLSGKQADVGAAIPAPTASSSSSVAPATTSEAPATTSAAPATTSEAPATTSEAPATTSEAAATTSEAAATTSAAAATTPATSAPAATSTKAATSAVAATPVTTAPAGTGYASGTGAPKPTTTGAVVTAGAALGHQAAVGVVGAVAFGAAFAIVY